MESALNTKQAAFVVEYLTDFNATQAAIRAGYSPDTAKQQGSRLLTHVDVRAAINDAIHERSNRTLISQDAVLLGLLEEARHTGEGSSHSARVSAWAHIGKHLGMFVDRVHTTGQQSGVTRIELVAPSPKDMTDDELATELRSIGIDPALLN
jgi:phage terminase small subunit